MPQCSIVKGQKLKDGKCVSICPTGQDFKYGTGCVCPEGQKFNNRGKCVATSYAGIKCPEGQVFNENKECVTKCPKGKILKGNKCVNPKTESQAVDNSKAPAPAPALALAPVPAPVPAVIETTSEPDKESSPVTSESEPVTSENEPVIFEDEPVISDDETEPCPEWKKHKAFKRNGKVKPSFCDDYAINKRKCERALSRMQKLITGVAKLESKRDKLEDELFDAKLSINSASQSKTEAGGLCFDCLKKVLNSSRPTAGENIGNVLTMLTGVGVAGLGYNIGQRAQTDANMLRVRQGYEAQNDYYALTGASMGFPYVAKGLYGLTRSNAPAGGWSCSPTASPYGRPYNNQMGQGFNRRYYR